MYVHNSNVKTVLFRAIQFSLSAQFSSIWPIDRTLSGATTPGQNGSGSDGNEGVLCIPRSSNVTGASPSDCSVLYPGHSLWVDTSLQRCSQHILLPQPTWPKKYGVRAIYMLDVRMERVIWVQIQPESVIMWQ